jgi:ribosomal protein S18 acetylase RimI-like enzyme
MHPLFRPDASHAGPLAELARATFTDTYVGMGYYTRELVADYTARSFAVDVVERELGDPATAFFCITVEGAMAAYVKLVDREPADCVKPLAGLYVERLYVSRRHQRSGFGGRLLEAAFAEARARSRTHLWLSAWEENVAAIAYYKGRGFHQAGEWPWVFESQGKRYVDRDLIFTIPVPPAS